MKCEKNNMNMVYANIYARARTHIHTRTQTDIHKTIIVTWGDKVHVTIEKVENYRYRGNSVE